MSHSACRVYVHTVFSVKFRDCLISNDFENKLFEYVRRVLEEHGCEPIEINGHADHVHILFRLGPNTSIAGIMKAIKGGSSHWINQQSLTQRRFAWQVGYLASSVSHSRVQSVMRYVRNQKEHHRKVTFKEEFKKLVEELGAGWVSD